MLAESADGTGFDERDGSPRYERAVRLVALLGTAPAIADDLAEGALSTPDPFDVRADMGARYASLRAVAAALADRLDTAGTDDERADALRLARRWGIAPPPDPLASDAQARRARDLLRGRLAAGPEPVGLDPLGLARAIAALVSPTGQIAVLSRARRGGVPALQSDWLTDWLTVVAAVRAPLARLEATQLATDAFAGWTNKRDDPWQTNASDLRRLVVVCTPKSFDLGSAPADAPIAVGVLDRFTEVIPGVEHTTVATLGFDAPGSRAPQAILLAIPPDLGRPLDAETVVQIVAEARELARVRAATLNDLEDLTGLVPLPLIPARGDTTIRVHRP